MLEPPPVLPAEILGTQLKALLKTGAVHSTPRWQAEELPATALGVRPTFLGLCLASEGSRRVVWGLRAARSWARRSWGPGQRARHAAGTARAHSLAHTPAADGRRRGTVDRRASETCAGRRHEAPAVGRRPAACHSSLPSKVVPCGPIREALRPQLRTSVHPGGAQTLETQT